MRRRWRGPDLSSIYNGVLVPTLVPFFTPASGAPEGVAFGGALSNQIACGTITLARRWKDREGNGDG
jgi:hypothetical protein